MMGTLFTHEPVPPLPQSRYSKALFPPPAEPTPQRLTSPATFAEGPYPMSRAPPEEAEKSTATWFAAAWPVVTDFVVVYSSPVISPKGVMG